MPALGLATRGLLTNAVGIATAGLIGGTPVQHVTPVVPLFIRQGPSIGGGASDAFDPRFDDLPISATVNTAPISAVASTAPVSVNVKTADISATINIDDE